MWEQSYIFNLEGKEELMHCNVWNEATLGDDQSGNREMEQKREGGGQVRGAT